MLKLFILAALTIFICLQTVPAYCGASRTMAFQVSVTIPEHVMFNNDICYSIFKQSYQLVQTQTVIRNNRAISLTSIVVP